jgi:hypothetical protein
MRRGIAMMSLSARASASLTLPCKRRSRTFGIAAAPAGLFRSRFSSAQTVSSLTWMRSFATPPKIIPPRRPFPIGSASFHCVAGCLYQSRFVCAHSEHVNSNGSAGIQILTGQYCHNQFQKSG